MRIDKFLSQLKYTTRSKTKQFLKDHQVTVNQQRIINANEDVNEFETIKIDDVKIFYKKDIYLMIHKPAGYISATIDHKHPCVVDLLQHPYDRFDFHIAGRLDIDTTGLLILSTDGQFIHDITHPKKHVAKTYIATLDRSCDDASKLLEGVWIYDDKNQKYLAKALDLSIKENEVNIVIDEGKYHQVKRMFESIGYKVIQLKRIRIGNLELSDLEEGSYCEIRKEDIYD